MRSTECPLVFVVTSAKEVMFSSLFVCLSVCLLATLRKNFQTDLHEIFREGWQWASEQMIRFWRRSDSRIRIRDAGKTCLGGGMHSSSASSIQRTTQAHCKIYK